MHIFKHNLSYTSRNAPGQSFYPIQVDLVAATFAQVSNLNENPPQIIKRPHIDALLPQKAIRRRQMKMKVRNRKLADIALARKRETPHADLHGHRLVLLALEGLGRDGVEELDGFGDAGLQLVEGGLVVGEEGVGEAADAGGEEFRGVAAGLDLVVEALARVSSVGIGWLWEGRLTASCRR